MDIPIAQIKAANRFRKDQGDIKCLASSIVAVGLMHQIVIRDYNQLIAGEGRLEACKMLGWKEIPVTILNIKEIIAGEHYENLARKDFAMSEHIAILEEIEKQRIGHRTSNARGARTARGIVAYQELTI
jgi:ParB family transcriptional regulator, chromosome partitioning protein